MRRPKINLRRLGVFSPVLLIMALVPMILTGFISTPGEKHDTAGESIVDIEALMKRVLHLNQNKQHQKAIEVLLSVIDKQREDSILRTLLVQTFDLFLEEEIKKGQKDIIKNRHNKSGYTRVAGALELLGDNFRSMEILLNGVSHNPKEADLWMKIARLELKADREMEALDVFREVIRLDKKNAHAFNNAAYLLARSKSANANDLKEAEKLAKKARKLDPKNPEYLDTLAEIHFRQGNQKQATVLIEQAIELAPKSDIFKNQLEKFKNKASLTAE